MGARLEGVDKKIFRKEFIKSLEETKLEPEEGTKQVVEFVIENTVQITIDFTGKEERFLELKHYLSIYDISELSTVMCLLEWCKIRNLPCTMKGLGCFGINNLLIQVSTWVCLSLKKFVPADYAVRPKRWDE